MKKAVFFILFLAVLLTGTAVFAEYKIILKNGREFIVDDYKDAEGKIRFYKMGGEIEIDKVNIESIKEIKGFRKSEDVDSPETVKKDSPAEKVQTEKPGEAGTKNQATLDRLKDIAKKKEVLIPERDKLSEEKMKLDDDLSKASMFMSTDKAKDLEKKAADIRGKISKFNEEIKKLNDEESRLVKEAEGKQK